MKPQRTFLNYIHQFRGFAILLIVGVHTLISIPWTGQPVMKNIFFSLTNNGTILFVFIAGFLFYYLSHAYFDYVNYLRKKLKYVILPYIIISIPAIVDKLFIDKGDHFWMDQAFQNYNIIAKTAYMLSTGRHSGILWFIPMITVFYLCSFILLRWSKHKTFNWLVPILLLVGLWTNQFGYYSNIWLSFLHFLPVYLFGMWFSKLRVQIFECGNYIITITAIIYLVFSFLEVTEFISIRDLIDIRDQDYLTLKFNPGKLKAITLCAFMILFFQRMESRNSKVLKLTGDYSFGIFFLHLYCINVFQLLYNKQWIPIEGLNSIYYLIYVTLITLLCLFGVYMVKLVFKSKSRLIIGS